MCDLVGIAELHCAKGALEEELGCVRLPFHCLERKRSHPWKVPLLRGLGQLADLLPTCI